MSAHRRARPPGHFLEIASLLPPPAALRRFPRRGQRALRTWLSLWESCRRSRLRGPVWAWPTCPPAVDRQIPLPCHCEEARRADVVIRSPAKRPLRPTPGNYPLIPEGQRRGAGPSGNGPRTAAAPGSPPPPAAWRGYPPDAASTGRTAMPRSEWGRHRSV